MNMREELQEVIRDAIRNNTTLPDFVGIVLDTWVDECEETLQDARRMANDLRQKLQVK